MYLTSCFLCIHSMFKKFLKLLFFVLLPFFAQSKVKMTDIVFNERIHDFGIIYVENGIVTAKYSFNTTTHRGCCDEEAASACIYAIIAHSGSLPSTFFKILCSPNSLDNILCWNSQHIIQRISAFYLTILN